MHWVRDAIPLTASFPRRWWTQFVKCTIQFLERPSSHKAVISSFCKFVPCPSQVTTPKTLWSPRGQGGGPQRKCDCTSSEHHPHSATSSSRPTGTSQSATLTPLSTAHLQPGYAGRPWEASAGNVTTQIKWQQLFCCHFKSIRSPVPSRVLPGRHLGVVPPSTFTSAKLSLCASATPSSRDKSSDVSSAYSPTAGLCDNDLESWE